MTQWLSKVVPYLAFPTLLLLGSGGHLAAQTSPGSAPDTLYSQLRVRQGYRALLQTWQHCSNPSSLC